jgi:hypothetical protein
MAILKKGNNTYVLERVMGAHKNVAVFIVIYQWFLLIMVNHMVIRSEKKISLHF